MLEYQEIIWIPVIYIYLRKLNDIIYVSSLFLDLAKEPGSVPDVGWVQSSSTSGFPRSSTQRLRNCKLAIRTTHALFNLRTLSDQGLFSPNYLAFSWVHLSCRDTICAYFEMSPFNKTVSQHNYVVPWVEFISSTTYIWKIRWCPYLRPPPTAALMLLSSSFACYKFMHNYVLQVTYILEGIGRHEDFCGHSGMMYPGDLQVMSKKIKLYIVDM